LLTHGTACRPQGYVAEVFIQSRVHGRLAASLVARQRLTGQSGCAPAPHRMQAVTTPHMPPRTATLPKPPGRTAGNRLPGCVQRTGWSMLAATGQQTICLPTCQNRSRTSARVSGALGDRGRPRYPLPPAYCWAARSAWTQLSSLFSCCVQPRAPLAARALLQAGVVPPALLVATSTQPQYQPGMV
jgi:hypothetical protein